MVIYLLLLLKLINNITLKNIIIIRNLLIQCLLQELLTNFLLSCKVVYLKFPLFDL